MQNRLPTTQSLRAFEVTAQHLNYTSAARELCLTPSAVYKQVQQLEEVLGVRLFSRTRYGLMLREAGQSYLEEIKPILMSLTRAGERIISPQEHRKSLRIHALPAFVDRWLIPRLSGFTEANPDLQVEFHVGHDPDEIAIGDFDVQIRYGDGHWRTGYSQYICGHQIVPVCSPLLLEQHPCTLAADDLPRFHLIEHLMAPLGWDQVFDRLGVCLSGQPRISRWFFYSVIIRSAIAGHGIALVPKCFVNEELRAGTLIQLLDMSFESPAGYYFTCLEARQHEEPIARFGSWLRAQRSDGESPRP